jgi:hypothetical protein
LEKELPHLKAASGFGIGFMTQRHIFNFLNIEKSGDE